MSLHWFTVNDNTRTVAGETIAGSLWRHGRYFLRAGRYHLFSASWCFSWRARPSLDVTISLGGEDSDLTGHLGILNLIQLWVSIGVPRRWWRGWMVEEREWGIRLGYIGDIAWLSFARDRWLVDCGMDRYYRALPDRGGYSALQLWPGWQLRLRWPPVLRWVFGRANTSKTILRSIPVEIPMDGRTYPATVQVEQWRTTRPRWPWPYRERMSLYLVVPNPPKFAGKGENSWDYGDDGIFGMGSHETQVAGLIGEYIKRVMTYRARYGQATKS